MSLIDFPDVPLVAGVPNLRRSAYGIAAQSGIMGKLLSNDVFGLLGAALAPTWGIHDKNGKVALRPDSVVAFEYRGDSRLAGYPMEQGAFSTYNKVQVPYDIRIRMTCDGSGDMSRDQFLTAMEYLKASLELYTIVTPDNAYTGANLVGFDYQRTSRNGVTLLTVDAIFQEVRETATAVYLNTAEASGADTVNTGTAKPQDVGTTEKSTIGKIADSVKSGIKSAGDFVGDMVGKAEAVYDQVGSYATEIAQQGKEMLDEVGGVAIELQDEVVAAAKKAVA